MSNEGRLQTCKVLNPAQHRIDRCPAPSYYAESLRALAARSRGVSVVRCCVRRACALNFPPFQGEF